MSKARGVVPLLLATTLGVVNGVWVFYPAFQEQKLERDLRTDKAYEPKDPLVVENQTNDTRDVEATLSPSSATGSALTTERQTSSSSWWPAGSLWLGGNKDNRDSKTTEAQNSDGK